MFGSRLVSALVGVALSVAVSAALWYYFDAPLVFLFVPLVPVLFWRRGEAGRGRNGRKRCPVCGFETRNPTYDHCPRDGTELRAER